MAGTLWLSRVVAHLRARRGSVSPDGDGHAVPDAGVILQIKASTAKSFCTKACSDSGFNSSQ